MNESLKYRLSVSDDVGNVAYLINNNTDFAIDALRFIQNQNCKSLLRCVNLKYNGKIKLLYVANGYKSLSNAASTLSAYELNTILINLIHSAMELRNNGFVSAENIELDIDKIFVDTSDYSVHFIYFPLSEMNIGAASNFERELVYTIVRIFSSFPAFDDDTYRYLCNEILCEDVSPEVLVEKIIAVMTGNYRVEVPAYNNNYESTDEVFSSFSYGQAADVYSNYGAENMYVPAQTPLMVTAINAPIPLMLTVDREEYLIGKNPEMVNGVINYNPAVSRVHCKISYMSGRYYITDMGSANGTYLNQIRLENQQPTELHNGDYLKLANSEFMISI